MVRYSQSLWNEIHGGGDGDDFDPSYETYTVYEYKCNNYECRHTIESEDDNLDGDSCSMCDEGEYELEEEHEETRALS